MGYYLGIDGGGTKTHAVLVDETGRELGRGAGGPCNVATLGDEEIATSITTACAGARQTAGLPPNTRLDGACAGVAGCTAKGRRRDLAAALPRLTGAANTHVEADFTVAYWGATEGRPGIVVSAGTGAVAFGRNAEGAYRQTDGRGFVLGDLGSAFWMGVQAVSITLEWLHGCAKGSAFTQAVADACDAKDDPDLVQWVYSDIRPARYAALARVVGEHAAAGDAHAEGIVTGAAGHLADSVSRCAAALEIPAGACEVYLLGGLWASGALLRELFVAEINRRAGGRWPIAEARHDPAYGGALLALHDAGIPIAAR